MEILNKAETNKKNNRSLNIKSGRFVVPTLVSAAILAAIIGVNSVEVDALILLLIIAIVMTFVLYLWKRLQLLTFWVLLFIGVALFDWVGYQPLITQPINIFYADIFLILSIIIYIFHASAKRKRNAVLQKLFIIMLLNFLYGLMMIGVGFIVGNTFFDVFGDFRRIYLYPFIVLLPLVLLDKKTDQKRSVTVFAVGLLVISLVATIRVLTGISWDPAQFDPAGDFRSMGYFTGILILMGVSYFYATYLITKGSSKFIIFVLISIFFSIAILSGYRLLWLLTFGIPILINLFSMRYRGRFLRILGISLLLMCFLIVAVFVFRTFSPDLFTLFQEKFYERVIGFRFTEDNRYYAWKTALEYFSKSPIVGVGIGDNFEYYGINSLGQTVLRSGTTHNIFFSILYQTGLFGALLFIVMHSYVLLFLWSNMRKLNYKNSIILFSMFLAYICALIMGMLQPVFETPGAIIMFYLWVGFLLNYCRLMVKECMPNPMISSYS
jgi:O-antigen ligase